MCDHGIKRDMTRAELDVFQGRVRRPLVNGWVCVTCRSVSLVEAGHADAVTIVVEIDRKLPTAGAP